LSPENQTLQAAELRGFTMTHPAWIATSRIRDGHRARWQEILQDVDVILCPPMPTPAFPHDHSPSEARELEVDGKKIPYHDQLAWAAIATLFGFPATVAPIAHTGNLPIGVQIIGGYLQDLTTIRFAELIGREFGGFTPPPLPG
jgi:amidase